MAEANDQVAATPVEEASRGRRFTFPWKKWSWLIIIAIIVALGGTFLHLMRQDSGGEVKTRALAPINEQELDKVGGVGSEEYQRQMERHVAQRIDAAAQTGETYVAPPQAAGKPSFAIEKKEEPQPRSQPIPPRSSLTADRSRARMQRPAEQKGDQQMLAYLNGLSGRLAAETGGQTVQVHNRLSGAGKTDAPVSSQGTSEPVADLQPGDILYAINVVSLDSDAPGPVMARIVSQKYKGAKLLGRFQRSEEHLVLEFVSLTTPQGVTYKIRGYAIDPRTDKTAVRSSVDTHFLERWGGLIASSFLEGFADAVSSSGKTTYNGIYGSSSTTPDYDINDQLWIAGGKVGQRAANVFEKHFDRPPTVSLTSGTELGVLIIDAAVKEERGTSMPTRRNMSGGSRNSR